MGKLNDPRRVEVESVMCEMEELAAKNGNPGEYVNYSFRRRQDVPGLQCVDGIAWTCYQYGIHLFRRTPMHRLTSEA